MSISARFVGVTALASTCAALDSSLCATARPFAHRRLGAAQAAPTYKRDTTSTEPVTTVKPAAGEKKEVERTKTEIREAKIEIGNSLVPSGTELFLFKHYRLSIKCASEHADHSGMPCEDKNSAWDVAI